MAVPGNTERLTLDLKVLVPVSVYSSDNLVEYSVPVEGYVDRVAPVIVHSSPAAGEVVSQDYLTFAILDLPAGAGSGVNRDTLSVWVDRNPYVSSGAPNDAFCKLELHETQAVPKLVVTIFPHQQLAVGEHTVRVYVEDNNGNALDTTYTFTQAYVQAVSEEVKLEGKKHRDLLWDIKWWRKCDHKLVRERHLVGPDLQTVRLDRTVVLNSEFRVYVNGRRVYPNDPVYGFEVILDPRSVEPYRKHMLYFTRSFRSATDLVEVTYTTLKDVCPKCHGQGWLFDINVDPKKNFFEKVMMEPKLVQEMNKIILTVVGSNPRYPWYGTSVAALIGEKGGGSPLVAAKVQREVYAALAALRDIKLQQRQLQEVPSEEMLEEVVSVKVSVDETDPTLFQVEAVVRVESGRFVETTTVIPFVESKLVSV